jgi:hypothetical protein
MKQPEPVPPDVPPKPPVVEVVEVEPPVVVVEPPVEVEPLVVVVEPPVVVVEEPPEVEEPLPVPEVVPPLVVVVVVAAIPVTETCRTILVPEFEHPTVRLVLKPFAELGFARTSTVQFPPAGMLAPQVFVAIVKILVLLSDCAQPEAATDELELVTVKTAEVADKVETVTFPRFCATEGLTERVTDPEPLVPPAEPPPAVTVVFT